MGVCDMFKGERWQMFGDVMSGELAGQ